MTVLNLQLNLATMPQSFLCKRMASEALTYRCNGSVNFNVFIFLDNGMHMWCTEPLSLTLIAENYLNVNGS